MEPTEKEQSGSGISFATAGVFAVIGAAVGAVGYHLLKKEPMEQAHHSRPGKVFSNGTCPICLSDMEELIVLPCGHQYHCACVRKMKASGVELKCPTCRKDFKL